MSAVIFKVSEQVLPFLLLELLIEPHIDIFVIACLREDDEVFPEKEYLHSLSRFVYKTIVIEIETIANL